MEVKQKLAKALNDLLGPIRERRAHFEAHPGLVRDALEKGCREAKAIAQETMAMVRDALQIDYLRSDS